MVIQNINRYLKFGFFLDLASAANLLRLHFNLHRGGALDRESVSRLPIDCDHNFEWAHFLRSFRLARVETAFLPKICDSLSKVL